MNDKLKEMLIKHEGYRTSIYKDSRGIATIGVGHNLISNPLPENMAEYLHDHGEITIEMLEELFESDVEKAEASCKRLYVHFPDISENRQNALIDFVFNVGEGTARTFKKTNACINASDWDGAAGNMEDSQWFVQVKGRAKEICH